MVLQMDDEDTMKHVSNKEVCKKMWEMGTRGMLTLSKRDSRFPGHIIVKKCLENLMHTRCIKGVGIIGKIKWPI